MSTVPRVTFVVPVHNNQSIIGATLESIAAQTIGDFACLVVDGVSTDGTGDYVREHFPWAQVIRKDTDSGPAASRSIGMLRSNTPFVALIDSDVRLDPTWTERQLELMDADPRVGVTASRLLYGANPAMLFSSHGAMNRYGVSWDGGQGEAAVAHGARRRCVWANTSAILVRREAIERAGAFDDRMYAGCEDSDFGWRVNICGFHVVYNPAAVAIHDVHGTFKPEGHRRLRYFVRRNRIRSLLVNYQLGNIFRYVLPYIALSAVESFTGERSIKIKALAWNFLNLPDTLRRRWLVQRRRTIPDRDFLPLLEEGIRGPGGDSMVRLSRGLAAGEGGEAIS